jgi:hypothetical protein
LARNLRGALIADIVEAHEDRIELAMKVGVLRAAGFSQAAIKEATGASAKDLRDATERLKACSVRLEAA